VKKGKHKGVDMKISEMHNLHQLSTNDLDLIQSNLDGKNLSDLKQSHLADHPINKKRKSADL